MRLHFLAASAAALAFSTAAWAQTSGMSGMSDPAGAPAMAAPAAPAGAPGLTAGASQPAGATAARDSYILSTGERLRAWYPVVDTYLDAGIPPERSHLQTDVRNSWSNVRREWDKLVSAPDSTWSAAHREFETAWSNFQADWTRAKNFSCGSGANC